ncbi:hypothetical protein [Streptomyces sp. NPDC048248]|uniref:hypothetical protein n=1 Tax=Streptomyces sp. NPDC048248 TaxID=3365523 RepID=UPI003724A429
MTVNAPEHATGSPATPPPGCPAHGMASEALHRLYGAEAQADPMGVRETAGRARTRRPVLVHGDTATDTIVGIATRIPHLGVARAGLARA